MKLLFLPNEWPHHKQIGMRSAIDRLVKARLIAEARVESPLLRIRQGVSVNTVQEELLDLIVEFRPDIILLQHPGGSGLNYDFWKRCRAAASFKLLLHEGDCYGRLAKRLPGETRDAARMADLTLTVGNSSQKVLLQRAGASQVRWTPSTFDASRFGHQEDTEVEAQVVMIANHSPSRFAPLSMPGVASRKLYATALAQRFGAQFKLFGKGWRDIESLGPLPFDMQPRVLNTGAVSTTWNHFPDEARFFSDRLPIALASGSPHVTNMQPEYAHVFTDKPDGLLFATSIEDAVSKTHQLMLDHDSKDSKDRRQHLRSYSQRFRDDVWLVLWLNQCGANIPTTLAAASSNIDHAAFTAAHGMEDMG